MEKKSGWVGRDFATSWSFPTHATGMAQMSLPCACSGVPKLGTLPTGLSFNVNFNEVKLHCCVLVLQNCCRDTNSQILTESGYTCMQLQHTHIIHSLRWYSASGDTVVLIANESEKFKSSKIYKGVQSAVLIYIDALIANYTVQWAKPYTIATLD